MTSKSTSCGNEPRAMLPNKANREAIPDGAEAEITFRVKRCGNSIKIMDGKSSLSGWSYDAPVGDAYIDYATSIKVLPCKPKVGDWVKHKESCDQYRLDFITERGDFLLSFGGSNMFGYEEPMTSILVSYAHTSSYVVTQRDGKPV